jgi:signal transduction histidine kinase/DNA-binding response OmpR family regulator
MPAAVSPTQSVQDDDARAGEMLAGIEAALKPRAPLLRLPEELEERYQSATWRGRNRDLRTWLILVAVIDLLCIGIDVLVMPEHILNAVIARGVVLTAVCLGAASLLMQRRPVWMLGLIMTVPLIALMLVAGYLASLAQAPHNERYLLAGLFAAFAATIVPNVPLRWVAAQALICVGIFLASLFALTSRSLAGNIELVTYFPVAILIMLYARHRIERMHRRNYLMTLRDEMRLADLAKSKAQHDATLANMSQGIVMRDAAGFVPIINRRAVELLGLPEHFLDGKLHAHDILKFQYESGEFGGRPMPPDAVARLMSSQGSDVPASYERTRPSGAVLEVHSTTLPDGGFVRTYTDITDRKRNETALAEARDTAEAASRARSEFLAMMSHEIRTPMNAVLGLTGSLLESSLTGEQRRSAEAIQEASDGLLSILNDILDLSKLDTGKLEFESLPFSVESVIDNTRSIVVPRATEKNLRFAVEVDPGMPKALVGDPNRIRQIVLNLASNAVKFTPSGDVVISAQCVARTDDSATVRIAVRDTGIGIAPDRVGRLFTDFVQADASIHRQYGGTGLGLAICKRLVEQMSGTIMVDSKPGRGSTFSFLITLPLAPEAELGQQAESEGILEFGDMLVRLGRPLRVLIAEDNTTNQLVVTRMLQDYDIDVRIAANGLEAVAAAEAGAFDVIFMDMRMPEMDGLDATRAIRQKGGALAVVPIVALTANAFADDMKACRDAGMNDFVAKPIRKRLLLEKLAKIVLASSSGMGDLIIVEQPRAAPKPTLVRAPDILIDRSVIEELLTELGPDTAAEVLRTFLNETRTRLARLAELSTTGDCAAIEIEAHTLKGAAGALGFTGVAERAFAVEREARAGVSAGTPAAAGCHRSSIDRIADAFEASCREMHARPLISGTPA